MALTAVPPVPGRWGEGPPHGRAPRTASEYDSLVDTLARPGEWPAAAAALLAELGFRLIGPRGTREDWHLLIALRDAPTLRHFDPEVVAYYAPSARGADLVGINRPILSSPGSPESRQALWGHVHVVDRVPVENRFLTFGGDLRIATVDPGFTVLDLVSPAPIVRWGGHSQGTDQLAEAIGAFFGRLIVPIDFVPGAAARIDAMPAGVLFRAFLADSLARAAAAERRGAHHTHLSAWIAAAWIRARRDSDACDAAQRLLRELGISPSR
jgi:hypothetical protein